MILRRLVICSLGLVLACGGKQGGNTEADADTETDSGPGKDSGQQTEAGPGPDTGGVDVIALDNDQASCADVLAVYEDAGTCH